METQLTLAKTTANAQKDAAKIAETLTLRLAEKLSVELSEKLGGIDTRLSSIERLLAGEPDKDRIGIMERLRLVEKWVDGQTRLLWIVIPLIISNIISVVAWIRK